MSADRESPRLYGRQAECERLAKLVDGVRGEGSAVLVVHGKPGTGKTAPLDFTARLDNSLKVVQVAGAESETELAFSGLHRLCGTMLELLGRLPDPQREAVEIAFGRQAGTGPDRFRVSLAVLGLSPRSQLYQALARVSTSHLGDSIAPLRTRRCQGYSSTSPTSATSPGKTPQPNARPWSPAGGTPRPGGQRSEH